jgi:3-hydroxyacyl-[acyl-carrier-protein] dehydratase
MLSGTTINQLQVDRLRPQDLLPHRPPMLLIDQLVDYIPGESILAETFIKPDTMFFQGHFPGEPILPGVVLVEMMFQACGIFGRLEALNAVEVSDVSENYRPKSGRAIKIDKMTFNKPVLPNDTVRIQAVFDHKMLNFSVFKARVDIDGRGIAAKGIVTVLINS